MFARKDDDSWLLWFDKDYAHVLNYYALSVSIVSKNGYEKACVTTELSGEKNQLSIFSNSHWNFLWSEMLEKSPFQQSWTLPNSSDDAKNLNLCIDIYEKLCRLKCINDSLKTKSDRIREQIQSVYFFEF